MEVKQSVNAYKKIHKWLVVDLTLKRLGGGAESAPPLDIFRDNFATQKNKNCQDIGDYFLSSLAHILRPFS